MKKQDDKVQSDPYFVHSTKYLNDIRQVLKDNPSGLTDKAICKLLKISPGDLESLYLHGIVLLRSKLDPGESDEV